MFQANDYYLPNMGEQGNAEPVINELFCYVSHNVHNDTKDQIVKAIYTFYDYEEIYATKEILYPKYDIGISLLEKHQAIDQNLRHIPLML